MNTEKLINSGIKTTRQIAKKALPKSIASTKVFQGKEIQITSFLDALASQGAINVKKIDSDRDGLRFIASIHNSFGKKCAINIEFDERYGCKNKILANLQTIITAKPFASNMSSKANVLSKMLPKFNELQKQDPQKAQYVHEIITQLLQFKTKTKEGVSDEYVKRFIEKLMDMDTILLKNICDNKIPITIYDDAGLHMWNRSPVSHASYIQFSDGTAKELQFSERYLGLPIEKQGKKIDTIESMAHEFGHAYDYNNGKSLHLTPQQLSIINDDDHLRFTSFPSMSKEFDEAFTRDFDNMLEIDKKLGKTEGSTFEELLQDPNFSYYFGVQKNAKGGRYNDITARKELYAQMVSYITTGKVSEVEFQEKIEELFPNLLDFTRKTLQK